MWNTCEGLSKEEQEQVLKALGFEYWFEMSTKACIIVDVKMIISWIRDLLLSKNLYWYRSSGDTTVMWMRWREKDTRKLSGGQLVVICRGHAYHKYIYQQEIRKLRKHLRRLKI